MPQSITVGAFAFGAVLLLIALLGGGFKIFGAEISGTAGRAGRAIAAVLGALLLGLGLYGSIQPGRAPEAVGTDSFAEAIRGVWTNEDPNTGSNTRLVILRKGPDIFVHAWGRCHPTDCDWGEVKGGIEGAVLKVTWNWVGGDRDMSIQLDGARLRVTTIDEYKDRRLAHELTQVFVRGS